MVVRRPRTPDGLGTEGRKLWREIVGTFDVTEEPHKRRILLDACKTADLIERLDTAMAGESLTSKGSMGQLVIHPLIAQSQSSRTQLAQLLSRLNFTPDQED
ncbi:P27 family phage terminase small subunit [Mycolicibacterium sp. PDY-3]|uniref:P27 family phage terminase small subunit n=1 Tax=Mycolicibacterium sp. PDY-3 TaxID=3376069 RepID=UPI0037BBE7A7